MAAAARLRQSRPGRGPERTALPGTTRASGAPLARGSGHLQPALLPAPRPPRLLGSKTQKHRLRRWQVERGDKVKARGPPRSPRLRPAVSASESCPQPRRGVANPNSILN